VVFLCVCAGGCGERAEVKDQNLFAFPISHHHLSTHAPPPPHLGHALLPVRARRGRQLLPSEAAPVPACLRRSGKGGGMLLAAHLLPGGVGAGGGGGEGRDGAAGGGGAMAD